MADPRAKVRRDLSHGCLYYKYMRLVGLSLPADEEFGGVGQGGVVYAA